MTENGDLSDVPQAERVPGKRVGLSVVWVIPILAALVGLGIAIQQFLNEGPMIRITFRAAEGIEAGKTRIKYMDVDIGKVTEVGLSNDYSRIVVTAKMEKQVEPLIVDDCRFWIVKPRVTLSGISGIGTLLSGNYIRFEPGKSRRQRREFVGIETPPPATSGLPGREFVLRADTLGSLGIGSPVYYRRINVGQVIGYDMAPGGKSVDIRIFLNAPYDRFVTSNTRFWEASGIDLSVGANGVSVRTESLLSLLVGGIAFETPARAPGDNAVASEAVFPLSNDRNTALSPRGAEVERFALYFHDSLRGLSIGAPVDFLGLPVGEVTDVGLVYSEPTQTIRTRVEVATYPSRFFAHAEKTDAPGALSLSGEKRRTFLQRQVVEKGLRAQLRSGNLVSGQLYVALGFFPDAPKAEIDWTRNPPRFPVVPGKRATIEAKVNSILAKLDKVPVEKIGKDLAETLSTLDRTLRRLDGETLPEARKTLATLDRTMESATRTLSRVDGEIVPEIKKTLGELRRAAASAHRALSNTDNTFLGPDAPAKQELRDALREFTRAARAIRVLADYLERNPNAILRGKPRESP